MGAKICQQPEILLHRQFLKIHECPFPIGSCRFAALLSEPRNNGPILPKNAGFTTSPGNARTSSRIDLIVKRKTHSSDDSPDQYASANLKEEHWSTGFSNNDHLMVIRADNKPNNSQSHEPCNIPVHSIQLGMSISNKKAVRAGKKCFFLSSQNIFSASQIPQQPCKITASDAKISQLR